MICSITLVINVVAPFFERANIILMSLHDIEQRQLVKLYSVYDSFDFWLQQKAHTPLLGEALLDVFELFQVFLLLVVLNLLHSVVVVFGLLLVGKEHVRELLLVNFFIGEVGLDEVLDCLQR
jgi:hypothetical protein